MFVNIGKYPDHISAYTIADKIFFINDNNRFAPVETWRHRCADKFGEWLSNTWVGSFLQWVGDRRKQHIEVKIDRWDTWSADVTLSHIIVPMLKQLRATKQGSPNVDDEDVPAFLKSTACAPKENGWDTDANWHLRWDWVLREMIWVFEQAQNSNADQVFYDFGESVEGETFRETIDRIKIDREGLKAWQDRKANAYRLFGKYYEALWD